MTNILLLCIVSSLVTNWIDSGFSFSTLMLPTEANTTTYTEYGTVYSNRLATVLIEGVTNTILLSSDEVAKLERSYTWSKPQKIYGKIGVLHNYGPLIDVTNICMTNYFNLTNLSVTNLSVTNIND